MQTDSLLASYALGMVMRLGPSDSQRLEPAALGGVPVAAALTHEHDRHPAITDDHDAGDLP